MASPPLSEFTSFSFQGTSLDSSWHGITPLDSSAEDIIQDTSLSYTPSTTNQWITRSLKKASLQLDIIQDTSLNYTPSTTNQWITRGLKKASLYLDETRTVVQVVGGDAAPTPGWED